MNQVYLARTSLWLRDSYFEPWLLKDDLMGRLQAFNAPQQDRFRTKGSHLFNGIQGIVSLQRVGTKVKLGQMEKLRIYETNSGFYSIKAVNHSESATQSGSAPPVGGGSVYTLRITMKLRCLK